MKRLRILTGRHVGSMLPLAPGVHRVGASHDCDVAVTDWDAKPLDVTVSDKGEVRFVSESDTGAGASADAGAAAGTLDDFGARRFGGIVLCVGPAAGDWPSDVDLLGGAFHPTPGRVVRWARGCLGGRAAFGSAAVAALVLLVAGLGWALLADSTPPPPTLEMARAQVQRALDQVKPQALRVVAVGGRLHVEGLVDTALQASQARAAIATLRGPHPVDQRFAAADEVVDAFRAALGSSTTTIQHDGQGGFTIAADVPNVEKARQVIDRLRADLGPVVRSVDARFEVTGAKSEAPILSRMTSDGLSFVQTRDGVKHLAVRSADDSPVTVSEALSLPPLLTPASPAAPAPRSTRKETTP